MSKIKNAEDVQLMGALRLAIGIGLCVAPGISGRFWMGPEGATWTAKAALRSLGAREVAIGLGLLDGIDEGRARTWLQAGVISDVADAANALFFFEGVHPVKRLAWVALPAVAAWYGLRLASDVE